MPRSLLPDVLHDILPAVYCLPHFTEGNTVPHLSPRPLALLQAVDSVAVCARCRYHGRVCTGVPSPWGRLRPSYPETKQSREVTWKYVISTAAHKQMWDQREDQQPSSPPSVNIIGVTEVQGPKSAKVPAALKLSVDFSVVQPYLSHPCSW